MVPNGWENKHLSEIASFSQGIQIPIENQYTFEGQNTCRFLRISDFVYQNEEPRFIDMPDSKFIVEEDDLSMIRYGSAGAGDLVKGLRGAIANNLFRVIPNELTVSKEYLWVYLRQEKVKDFLFSGSTSSTMPAVSFKLVGKVPVAVPPLPEQRKIAQILSTWDRGIATTEKLIDASKQQKKALMQQLLTGKKRLVDPETGKAFEGEWEEVKVKSLITKHSEKTERSGQYPVLTSSRKGIFFQSDYYNDRDVASEDTTGYNVVPRGFFTYRHMSDDLVFKFNINSLCDRGIVSTLYPVFAAKENIVVPYLLRAILNDGSEFKRFSLSQKQGGSRTYMYLSKLNELKIKIPKLKEQQKIASVLTAADKDIELLEAKLAHFKQEKKALMQQLLTGKRRVKVPETEAA